MAKSKTTLKNSLSAGALMVSLLAGCGSTDTKTSDDAGVSDTGASLAGGNGGTAGSTGTAGNSGVDAGLTEGGLPPDPPAGGLVLRSGGITSLGGIVTAGTLTLYDDGFEVADRACSADGTLCVTGGIVP